MNYKSISTLLLLLLSFSMLAQESREERKITAEKYIEYAKSGVLIVRLPSSYKKMQVLGVDSIQEQNHQNRAWIRSFETFYRFGEVLFTYDTTNIQTLEKENCNCFLNEQLSIDPTLKLKDSDFLMVIFRREDQQESMVFVDRKYRKLLPPFPSPVSLTRWNTVFYYLLFPDKADQRVSDKAVSILNGKFRSFYKKI